METIDDLIARTKAEMAGMQPRREALREVHADIGRAKKENPGLPDLWNRAQNVRMQLADMDAQIAAKEVRLRELEAIKADDERVEALAKITTRSGASQPEDGPFDDDFEVHR